MPLKQLQRAQIGCHWSNSFSCRDGQSDDAPCAPGTRPISYSRLMQFRLARLLTREHGLCGCPCALRRLIAGRTWREMDARGACMRTQIFRRYCQCRKNKHTDMTASKSGTHPFCEHTLTCASSASHRIRRTTCRPKKNTISPPELIAGSACLFLRDQQTISQTNIDAEKEKLLRLLSHRTGLHFESGDRQL